MCRRRVIPGCASERALADESEEQPDKRGPTKPFGEGAGHEKGGDRGEHHLEVSESSLRHRGCGIKAGIGVDVEQERKRGWRANEAVPRNPEDEAEANHMP